MKTNRLAIFIAAAISLFGIQAKAADQTCTTLLRDGKWTKFSISAYGQGNMQGSAFLPASLNGIDGKDRIYVFKQRPASQTATYCNSYSYYEPSTNTWHVGSNEFTWAPQTHMGSASFGPEVLGTYTGKDGQQYTTTIPFVYVTGHTYVKDGEIVAQGTSGAKKYITCVVLDLENERIVNVNIFPDRADDCIIAYDWGTPDAQGHYTGQGRLWVIGYTLTASVGVSPYVIDEYRRVDMSDFLSGNPSRWDYATASSIQPQTVELAPGGGTSSSFVIPSDGSPYALRLQGGGPDTDGIQKTLECGTVQDCFYYDNHIYIVTGRGSLYNRTEYCKIHCYYVAEGAHDYDKTIVTACNGESQGLVFDGTNIWMTMSSTGPGIYKYAPRNGDTSYDNLNSKEAQLVTDTNDEHYGYYKITNGYELVWFLQQVYAGCTQYKCYLANDIDMSGISLSTSYYIYDETGKFESQYAFRGIFDGNHKTISNLSIGSTDYDNDGMFPYVLGATIKDVTMTGSIKLSNCTTYAGSNQPVSNVGFIGYMNGGTVSGVNVVDFDINYNGKTPVDGTVSKLIGKGIGVNVVDCTIETDEHPTHATYGGHKYVNGICQCSDACDPLSEKYQTPGLGSDHTTYMIANAGNLIWFANHVKTNPSASAKLANDIDLDCGEEFLGFSTFSGTFDGQGFKISNYSRTNDTNSTTGFGFFNVTNGATIKNFTLAGVMNITGANNKSAYLGAVIGKATNTTIEDVTSSVNINTDNTVNGTADSGVRILGGIVGWTDGCTVRRCRYNGKMTLDASTNAIGDRFAGIVGMTQTTATNIIDCLFDGEIETYKNTAKIAGILGRNAIAGSTITNCLSVGTLKLLDVNAYTGMIIGFASNAATVSNTHYTKSNFTVNGTEVGTTGYNTTGTLNDGSDWPALTTTLNAGADPVNWAIVPGQAYPVPYLEAVDPDATYYTITFYDYDNEVIKASSVKEGAPVTAPEDPTRTGYDFAGWTPTVVSPAVANADYKATYSIKSYTITYKVDGEEYDTQTYEYGATVTPLEEPTQEGYTFSGWSDVPTTMPAEDVTVTGSFTIESDDPNYANGFYVGEDPITDDNRYQEPTLQDGYYLIKNAGNLWWLAQYVNANTGTAQSPVYVSVNAKLTRDINMEGDSHGSFPGIGCSNTTVFRGVFDGQGHSIYNYSQTVGTGIYRSGLITCISGANAQNKAIVKNMTLKGTKTFNGGSPMHGTVVGDVGSYATVEDVFCEVDVIVNTKTSMLGGITGCVQSNSTVNRCTYSGTITNNGGISKVGGIVGELRGGTVSNCLFSGTIIDATSGNTVAAIAGSSNSSNSKVANCLSIGTVPTNLSSCRIVCATGSVASTSTNNYTSTNIEADNLCTYLGETAPTRILNGEACALLNANSGQWSQILGYQTGEAKTANSPAQANPVPGTAYPVTKDASGNYTIAYLFLDDAGDVCTLPTDATSIKAKKIVYTRAQDALAGYFSVCMPFALSAENLSGASFFKFNSKSGDNVALEAVDNVAAGVPCFVKLSNVSAAWTVNVENNEGVELVSSPVNPTSGILGSLNTVTIGTGYYKLDDAGESLLITTESSSCFPYRAYLKLPAVQQSVSRAMDAGESEVAEKLSITIIEEPVQMAE